MTEISDGKQQFNCKFHDDDGVCTVGWGQFSYSLMKRSVKLLKCILKRQRFGRSGTFEYYRRYHVCEPLHKSYGVRQITLWVPPSNSYGGRQINITADI